MIIIIIIIIINRKLYERKYYEVTISVRASFFR